MRLNRRAALLSFTLGVLLVSTGASWPLNPLVTRNPHPPAAVPVECDQGLAPAPAPRVNVAEIPAPAEILPAAVPAAPPSRTLRRTLEDAHAALTRNDRPAFDEALAGARLILRDYPPGAERTNAEEAVRAYGDAAFLWDAQFRSPFFDQSSEAYARASRYPGYAEAVRRGLFTDDADRRFYPAAESRAFLAGVASERLRRLGIRTPATRVARADRPRLTPPAVKPAPTTSTSTPRRTPPRRAARNTQSRKSATPAMSAPASPDPPAPSRTVTESAPAAPPAAAPTPAAAPASPAAEGQVVDDVPEPATDSVTPDTALTTPAPSLPPPPAAPAPASAGRRSVVVPALLIVIGLGVLFVLFKVSK